MGSGKKFMKETGTRAILCLGTLNLGVVCGCGVWMGWGSHSTTSGVCGSGQLYVSSPGWVFSSAIYPACELS